MNAQGERVVIFGTGALACLFGARLARAGAAVTLAGTWKEALAAIEDRGIRVEEGSAPWSARVSTAHVEQALDPADLVLVLVKSHRTGAVASMAAASLAPGGTLVTLQNGLGNREALEAALPAGRVAAGIVTLGATLLGPGHVRAHPGEVLLGATPSERAALESAASLFRTSGIPTELTEDLESAVWRKLAVNCGINALSALRGVTNGGLLARPEDRDLLARAAREVAHVAEARGVRLGGDCVALVIRIARATSGNRSSMLQDVARGAPTEIEALNGAVVREGRRLDVPTPVNDWLYTEVLRLTREKASETPLSSLAETAGVKG